MAERQNDKGVKRLALINIDTQVDWDADEPAIISLKIDNETCGLIKEQVGSGSAEIYLDVTSGYYRQRFHCGTVDDLPGLDPICIETKSKVLQPGMPTNAKFEVNIVNAGSSLLYRRSPGFRTTKGEEMDLFYFNQDSTLGEIPWRIETPDINSSDGQTTIHVSSEIWHSLLQAKNDNVGVEWMIFVDAMRAVLNTIGMNYIKDDDSINTDGFHMWMSWLKSALKIDPPADNDVETTQQWVNDSMDKVTAYYRLATKINRGMTAATGGVE